MSPPGVFRISAGGRDVSRDGGVPAAPPNSLPHWMQNLAPGGFSVPQDGHAAAREEPQDMQNFAPAGFSVPQLGQIPAPMRSG
jgi:hypothetical protein